MIRPHPDDAPTRPPAKHWISARLPPESVEFLHWMSLVRGTSRTGVLEQIIRHEIDGSDHLMTDAERKLFNSPNRWSRGRRHG